MDTKEKRELWKPGRPTKGFNLMVRCIQEKCEDSDWHKKENKDEKSSRC